MRPRSGITLLARARAPLTLILFLAGREKRLLWESADAFVVLQMPSARQPLRRLPRLLAALRAIDRGWELIGFLALPLAAALAATVALLSIRLAWPPEWLTLAAGVTCVTLLAGGAFSMIVGGLRDAFTRFVPRDLGKYRAYRAYAEARRDYWSVILLHAADPQRVPAMLKDLAAGQRFDGRLLCSEDGVTTHDAVQALRSSPSQRPLSSAPSLRMLSADSGWTITLTPLRPGFWTWGRAVTAGMIVGQTIAVLALLAFIVSDVEAAGCAPPPCTDRPATYGQALYWLIKNMFGGDPEGIGATTLTARVIGVAANMLGVALLGAFLGNLLGWRLQPPADLDSHLAVSPQPTSSTASAVPTRSVEFHRKRDRKQSPGSASALAAVTLVGAIAAGILISIKRRRRAPEPSRHR